MATDLKRWRGLFGSNAPPFNPGAPADPELLRGNPETFGSLAQPQQQPQKKGLFGKGGVGRAIAGTVGDYLMQRQGMAPVYAPTVQAQQQAAAQAAEDQRKRSMELADWKWKQDYQRDNAPPDMPSSVDEYNAVMQMPEEEREAYINFRRSLRPIIGPDGMPYYSPMPGAQPQVLGETLPEGWTIEGDAGGNASGGFRR